MIRLLVAFGTVLLGYCAWVRGDAWLYQRQAIRALDEPAAAVAPPAGLIGRIEIPRIGLSAAVFEGTGRLTLQRSVGHIARTALPGQRGNIGLAGHRDSFFRPLQDVRRNDIITVTTLGGEAYRYRVVSLRVVPPSEISVLHAAGAEVLTLVTCYPFYFAGAAPSRFIVRAERVG